MHLHSLQIKNIRLFGSLLWEVPVIDGSRAGWHVIIGDNGSGKSTVLRAAALALIGAKNAGGLREDWNEWLTSGNDGGECTVWVQSSSDDQWSGKGKPAKRLSLPAGIIFKRDESGVVLEDDRDVSSKPTRHVWSGRPGWFNASFGPFRRFTGGNKDAEKLFFTHPRLARHVSVFGEEYALTECLTWLSQLRFEQLDKNKRSGDLLQGIKSFINQKGFLPHEVRFHSVTSQEVKFVDANGTQVPVGRLGDGFRSILSLAFELLRQMAAAWPDSDLFEKSGSRTVAKHSGVVMIDEIDAHLHPSWQKSIGFWLTEHFPKVQFIVTTHSPLVCHAAEKGSVFRLPTPGTDEPPAMVEGEDRKKLIFGSVLDAYDTELFGENVVRSDSAQVKQKRLASLNQKALSATPLSASEKKEREELQKLFPASMDIPTTFASA